MTLPYRQWIVNPMARNILCSSDDNSCGSFVKWTDEHYEWIPGHVAKAGASRPGAGVYENWYIVCKPPVGNGFALEDGADEVVDYGLLLSIVLDEDVGAFPNYTLRTYVLIEPAAPDTWNEKLVTGAYYDGENQWPNYPPTPSGTWNYPSIGTGEQPFSEWTWIKATDPHEGNIRQEHFFRNGIYMYWATGGIGLGEHLWVWVQIPEIRANFLNPVVNSLSRMSMPETGGVELKLYGLGFDQDDAELSSTDRHTGNLLPFGGSWASLVDKIHFVGKQGQGTTTLSRMPAGEIVVDSDTEITIPSMPALAPGTYEILLEKEGVGVTGTIGDVEAYAGDWRTDEDGRMTKGERFVFLVGEESKKKPIIFSKWRFKKRDGEIFQYWAPIDIRSTDRFYDGRLINESGITRSIDDTTGLPNVSDMTVSVAIDQELRQLLAEYWLKNQLVSLYFGWADQPEAWKEDIVTMIVDDYDLEGDVLKVTLKDISQKYFRITVPKYLITLEEYPNAKESSIGQPMPEALGLCSKTEDPAGAIEAHCVDTVAFKYLALRGSAHAILQVYSDGTPQTEGAGNDYTISYEDGGRTYINFNADQGDNKITFNCEGYMFDSWNSDGGYVQNPAYILAFLFCFMAEVPDDEIDFDAIEDLADFFDDAGYEESGYWIGQSNQPFENVVREMGFTFGIKTWPDKQCRFTFGVKDISNYQTDVWIFEQIDALKPSVRKEGFRNIMNFVKAQFGYIPTASSYLGALEFERESAIDDFEARIEADDSPWAFPWTLSEALVESRVNDELHKLGYGQKEIHFSLPIDWISDLDIFDNFIYQNPFAPTLSGEGESQRYYYVKSLSYDFVNNTIDVTGIDLQYLLRQYMIIGACADMAESWDDATEEMRMFGYICDCDSGFPDGEDCKKIRPG